MMNNFNKNNRKSVRLKKHNYKKDAFYFITICIQSREHLLGKISNDEHIIYDAGYMIQSVWNNLPKYYEGIKTHQFVVMPNHIHGVIELVNSDLDLSEVIRRYKTFTTRQYIIQVEKNNWQPFFKKLWQRNYYEHIIRDEKSWIKIQEYIQNNPKRWEEDVLYLNG